MVLFCFSRSALMFFLNWRIRQSFYATYECSAGFLDRSYEFCSLLVVVILINRFFDMMKHCLVLEFYTKCSVLLELRNKSFCCLSLRTGLFVVLVPRKYILSR